MTICLDEGKKIKLTVVNSFAIIFHERPMSMDEVT